MDRSRKKPRIILICFFSLYFLSSSGHAQSSKKEKYGPILQKLRNAAALKELNQELGTLQKDLIRAEELPNSSPQDLQLKQAKSEEIRIQIANLGHEVQANLQQFSTQDKSPAKEAVVNLDGKLKALLDSFSKSWAYNSQMSMTLSARDSAQFIAGTLRLERLTKLAEWQADRIEFSQTEALSTAVIAATNWVEVMKRDDPGLMTSGNLYNSYCIDFILETFPLGRPPLDLQLQQQKPQPPISKDPMQKLYGICQIQDSDLREKRNDNPWLQMFPTQGQSNLDIGQGSKVDCDAVSQSFQSYLSADEENSKILDQLIAILDDYLADRMNDAQFHSFYDPLELTYLEGLDQLTQLYPEQNFQRVHSLQVTWKLPAPLGSGARFVPWIVDFGPNSWNGSWSASLESQDWYHVSPTFDANRGLGYSVKASIHDVCVDHRTVSLFGFWGDSSCSGGSCLFIKPGLWLQAGG